MEMSSARSGHVHGSFSFNGAVAVFGQNNTSEYLHESSSTATSEAAAASLLFASSPDSLPDAGTVETPASSPDPASAGATVIDMLPRPTYNTWSKQQVMKSLNESIPHKKMLQQLHRSDSQFQKEGSRQRKDVRRTSKSLYVFLGCYAVLQSAIFAAVAQTNLFSCEDRWGPAAIAGMVALGTLFVTLDKLSRMANYQQQVLASQDRQNAVYDNISVLYLRGSACNLDSLQIETNSEHDFQPGLLCVFSPYGLLVLFFLAAFSALIIFSCVKVLCAPCKCHS